MENNINLELFKAATILIGGLGGLVLLGLSGGLAGLFICILLACK